jgi:hypothetical protein
VYLKFYDFLKKCKQAAQYNTQVHKHNTGANMDLHIKPCNTNLYKSVIIMGIWLYNCMIVWLYDRVQIDINNLEEYKPYKKELKSFLLDHVFYSVRKNLILLI